MGYLWRRFPYPNHCCQDVPKLPHKTTDRVLDLASLRSEERGGGAHLGKTLLKGSLAESATRRAESGRGPFGGATGLGAPVVHRDAPHMDRASGQAVCSFLLLGSFGRLLLILAELEEARQCPERDSVRGLRAGAVVSIRVTRRGAGTACFCGIPRLCRRRRR